MTFPSQFSEWLMLAERDGLGGIAAEPPAIVRGQPRKMVINLPADPEFGNWTSGAFAARLRSSPGAADPVLASYTVTVGTPASGLTPVSLVLSQASSAALPAPPVDPGWSELFFALTFTPSGGVEETIIATRQLIKARV